MSTRTAMADALVKGGIVPRNVKLQMALAEYQNNGGEYGVALAMLNAAYGKGSGGQLCSAGNGPAFPADAPGEEGHGASADKARPPLPSSPPTERSEGHTSRADQVGRFMPAAAPRPMPGHAKRGAVAIGAVDHVAVKSLFDTTVLPDGRRLREVRWSECPALATQYRRHSRILMAVHNYAIPPEPSATLDAIVNEAELQNIISAVEKFNEIH